MKSCFANSALEERMLLGKERNEVIAAAIQRHTGSQNAPVNTTEILMSSVDNDCTLLGFFESIDKLSKEN